MNERTDFQGKVVVVPPRLCRKDRPHQRSGGLYQLCLRGRRNGETVDQCRIVSCISRAVDVFEEYDAFLRTAHNPNMRFILSNHRGRNRLRAVQPDGRPPPQGSGQARTAAVGTLPDRTAGVHHFPCELIADNGGTLRDCVLRHARDWGWKRAFPLAGGGERLCSTLVDRIVTGYSPSRPGRWRSTGLEDKLLDVAEPFAQWIIEAPEGCRGVPRRSRPVCPCACGDHRPTGERKVRILNGGHTVLTPAALPPGTRWCAPAWRTGG